MDSVKTALKVLEQLALAAPAGVSDLARAIDAPKSTIQRDLTTLHEAGWIRPVEHQGRRRWTLSAKVLTLARGLQPALRLRELALPAMEELRDLTRETIHLMLRDGNRVVLIERLDSPQTLRTVRQLGASAPLHATSNGKAILAHLSTAERAAYLARPLRALTERTLTDPAALERDLEGVRARGFSLGDGELDPDVRAVAAPIRLATDEAIAALSISCPAFRFPDDRIGQYGEWVRQAAAKISRELREES
ncbi:MAG TPA: IclR family transcriptional regulator [Caulobacteraceae bacterium]|jgi:IclR family acetate operon transcriptional repressor|nr:IclR family transcriptional regulator [Caulobacteraceae bacterium]